MAIRYIPALEVRADGTFVATNANTLCNGLETYLSLAGWAQKSGTRAGAYLRATFFGIQNGTKLFIGGFCFQAIHPLTDADPACIAVDFGIAGGNQPATYQALAQAINGTPACGFRAVHAGLGNSLTTDGGAALGSPGNYGIDIESISLGTAGNDTPALLPAINNDLVWFSYQGGTQQTTKGGGYRLQSKRTAESLACRLRIYVDSAGPQVQIASEDESWISSNFTPTAGGLTYRILSNPYQFYALTPGATSSFLFASTPALPPFLKSLSITSVTNSTPIQVTTAGAHGLVNNDEVFIGDALDLVGISSFSGAPTYGLDLIRPYRAQVITAGHQWTNGQVVTLTGVTGAGLNGTWKIREADATTFVLEDAHFTIGSGGQITGPRNSTNGVWTVTKINDNTISLNTSNGSSAGTYVASSGLLGKTNGADRKLARCIFLTVTGGGNSFRTSMYHGQTGAYAVNGSNYTGGDSTGSPRTVFPGLVGKALLWSSDCAIMVEPYLTLGINGLASEARLIGQPWDMALITQDYTNEATAVFDTHNWLKVTGTQSAGLQWGSLWVVTS